MSERGRFISLEGGEGAGKSTVLKALQSHLQSKGQDPMLTREPGGTALGEAIRELLLDPAWSTMCAETELLLMFASRAQLVRETLLPTLESGRWVISDRFTDASFAYQGGGRGLPASRVRELEQWAALELRPDLTLLLDLDTTQGRARAAGRGPAARIERDQDCFFERVRETYLRRAEADPQRFRVIDAGQPLEQVVAAACAALDQWLDSNP